MNKKIIYCLDCDENFCKDLKRNNFEIITGYLGYSRSHSQVISLPEAPNECDVLVFNLIDPACFDMNKWGPYGGNDNSKCTIEDKVNKSMYISGGAFTFSKKYPRFKLIQESQISNGHSTFDYTHLQKAIFDGGIDCIYYLNTPFMFHSLYDTPDWVGFRFNTAITKVKRWELNKNTVKMYDCLSRLDNDDLKLVGPIEFSLLDLIPNSNNLLPNIRRLDLLVNNVNETFATIVKFGKGFVYFLPPFKNSVEATAILINEILPNFKRAYEMSQISETASILDTPLGQKEKIYAPGDQYTLYKDLKEIIVSARNEIFVIDTYANEDFFDLYIDKIKNNTRARFLTKKPSKNLVTVINKFKAKQNINFEARESNEIHDRVIFIDDKQCWVLGHSIKDGAVKQPTYLIPVDSIADMKKLYEDIWIKASIV
ncbi:MAG: hypothetical protein KJ619_00395 [Candidatus Omnitrophica bacterium]|nr:hypothetical protein [Candidatus Omnitrophota bacterium]